MLVESQNSVLTTVMATQEALFNVDGGYAHRKILPLHYNSLIYRI
jgi:hypothetical protein